MDRMKQFRDQSVEELKALYLDFSKEIYDIRTEIAMTHKTTKPHKLSEKKRDRARVLTLLAQKEAKL